MKVTKDTPHAVGSAITYARRYGLSSMICISADEDDDAESAQPDRSVNKGSQGNKVSPIDSKKNIPRNKNKVVTADKDKPKNPQSDRVIKVRNVFCLSAKLGHTPEEMKAVIGNLIGLKRPIKESAEIKDGDLDMIIQNFEQQLNLKEAA